MELHGKQVLAILEKPLNLGTKVVMGIYEGLSRKPVGGSRDGHFNLSPSTHVSITSNPLVPTCLLLVFGFLLITTTPIQTWLTTSKDLPTLAQFFSSPKKGPPALPRASEGVSVWTIKQSGFYYCEGGLLFGNKPGEMMAQGDALMSGYQPGGGKYCANTQPTVASSDNPSSRSYQPLDPTKSVSDAAESSVLLAKALSGTTMEKQHLTVWVKKRIGLYFCQDDDGFGTQPGLLMTQAEAVAAGYQASATNCTNARLNQASAGDLSDGYQQPANSTASSLQASQQPNQISANSLPVPKQEQRVGVWVKTDLGFYYCRNDVLFGSAPGQLMTQAHALLGGYQPSDGHCTNAKSPRTSAEAMSPHALTGRK